MTQHRILTAKARRPAPAARSSVATPAAELADRAICEGTQLRHELIAVQAYLLAEARGFTPEGDLSDWLAAEALVDARLRASRADNTDERLR